MTEADFRNQFSWNNYLNDVYLNDHCQPDVQGEVVYTNIDYWFVQFNVVPSYLFKTKFKIDEKFNAKGIQNNVFEIILQRLLTK